MSSQPILKLFDTSILLLTPSVLIGAWVSGEGLRCFYFLGSIGWILWQNNNQFLPACESRRSHQRRTCYFRQGEEPSLSAIGRKGRRNQQPVATYFSTPGELLGTSGGGALANSHSTYVCEITSHHSQKKMIDKSSVSPRVKWRSKKNWSVLYARITTRFSQTCRDCNPTTMPLRMKSKKSFRYFNWVWTVDW